MAGKRASSLISAGWEALSAFFLGARNIAINPKITLDGVAVENYFSPKDKVMDKLAAEVNNAKHFKSSQTIPGKKAGPR